MDRNATLMQNILYYALRFFLLTLTMWVVLNFSFFNTSGKLDKYMQDLFNTHFAEWVYPNDNQDSVAVLLLTDQIVDSALDGQWPAPYTFHAAVLDDLLQHRPKAVFIDFYWMNRLKPGSDYLVSVLEEYRNKGIFVYLAVPSAQWFENFWPELIGLAIPVSASIALDPVDFVSRRYPQADNGLPSAAFAIAEDVAKIQAVNSPRGNMDIFWGTAKNPKNWLWMEQTNNEEGGWLTTFKDGFSSVGTSIPYSTTVFVRDLINPVGESEEAAQDDLSNHLRNRIIIYAANLSGIQDYVFLPTRNILPGAYYHAMAIDNLLTWQGSYKSETANLHSPYALPLPLWLVQTLILLPLSAAFLWHNTSLLIPRPKRTQRLRTLTFWLGLLLYVSFVCWYQFSVLDLSVATWVGFVQLLGVGVLFEKIDLVERIISFPKWLSEFSKEWVQGGNNE